MDRILYSSGVFPADYGFLPQTSGDDDALARMQEPVQPRSILPARPTGVMTMADSGRRDEKVPCVQLADCEERDRDTPQALQGPNLTLQDLLCDLKQLLPVFAPLSMLNAAPKILRDPRSFSINRGPVWVSWRCPQPPVENL